MATNKKTKIERVLSYLEAGNDLTESQARSRFGVENLSAMASHLRNKGHAIFANRKVLPNGTTVVRYRKGTPPRRVVAAGYAALREQGERAA